MLKKTILFCFLIWVASGCAYRHYMGMHGPSIRAYADIHQGVFNDQDCLGCHHPDNGPSGPPTSHPQFTGCIKCHNDRIKGE